MKISLNKNILSLFYVLLFTASLSAQNYLDSLRIDINTFRSNDIYYTMVFEKKIDESATGFANRGIQFSLVQGSGKTALFDGDIENISVGIWNVSFVISLSDNEKDLINLLQDGEEKAFIEIKTDLLVKFADSTEYRFTPREIKELSSLFDGLNAEQTRLLNEFNSGRSFEAKNNFDFGREVNQADTTDAEYIFSFDVVRPFLKIVGEDVFFSARGAISTDPSNTLNQTEFFLSYKFSGKEKIFAEIGRKGTQDFSTNSIRANLGLEFLAPNLIDLTNGAPRLRLKPYVKAGVGFHKNFQVDNAFNNEDLNLVGFFDTYYYIPIDKNLFAITNASGSYSDSYAGDDKFLFQYDLTIGYQTPVDAKVLFKVESGENEVNRTSDTRFLIGLLVDFIK